jgi:hypothetical protein
MRFGLFLAVVAACGGGSDKKVDAGPPDACSGSTACSDPCNQGNELGVGRYCTPGHGECNQNGSVGGFIFCTKDYEPTEDVQYCTGACKEDKDCGTNAYCSGSGMGSKGCIPMSCGGVPSVDAGVDAN